MKLNQVIAVEKGIKSCSCKELTEAHQTLQKPALLAGIARTYRPKDEEGEPEYSLSNAKSSVHGRYCCMLVQFWPGPFKSR